MGRLLTVAHRYPRTVVYLIVVVTLTFVLQIIEIARAA
jgi:hypothetical protein